MSKINYGYDRLEHVDVIITEREYEEVIHKLAIDKVKEDGKVNPEDWGWSIEFKEQMTPDFTAIKRWAEVEFHRRVKENEEE